MDSGLDYLPLIGSYIHLYIIPLIYLNLNHLYIYIYMKYLVKENEKGDDKD